MRAFPVLPPVSRSASSAAFSPSSLSGLLQWALDRNPTYYASTLQSLPILTPEETGAVAVPRGQRCALFDGVNDYATSTTNFSSLDGLTQATFCAAIQPVAVGEYKGIISRFASGNDRLQIVVRSSGAITVVAYTSGAGTEWWTASGVVANGVTSHVAVVFDGSQSNANRIKVYVDGTLKSMTVVGTMPTSLHSASSALIVGAAHAGDGWFSTKERDVRVYNVAKSPTEIAAIYNQASTPTTIDTTGLLGMWPLQEESGTTAYDISGNGKHLTLTNITQATFHATDSGVTYNYNNWKGHTLSGNVVIPASLSTPSQDAAGNALGVVGPLARPVTVDVQAWTGDGSAAYVDCGSALIPATADFSLSLKYYHTTNAATLRSVLSQNDASVPAGRINICANSNGGSAASGYISMQYGGTFTSIAAALTASTWHTITFSRVGDLFTLTATPVGGSTLSATATYAGASISNFSTKLSLNHASNTQYNDGRLCDLSITTGGVTKYPLFDQCGPGTSNTNRDFYILGSDGSATLVSGGIVNGTISNIYANRCPYVKDHCIQYGGGIAANGSFIPGRIGSANDAAGNAKTLTAGKHGNPYSRLVPNYWSAPELVNIGYTSSSKLAPSDTVQATSPADTKFARIKAAGSDRYFATLAALTGSNKTNAESYVA